MIQFSKFLEDMKADEAKCGNFHSPASIPFAPLVERKTDAYEVHIVKIHIWDKVEEKCVVLAGGDPDKYLQFLQIVAGFILKNVSRLIPIHYSPPSKSFNLNVTLR